MIISDRTDATWVAGLLALCGTTLGGVSVPQEMSDGFASAYNRLVGSDQHLRPIPASLAPDVLTGALDLAATLSFGFPVYTAGLLATHPQFLVRRAEALDAACTSLMAEALDRQEVLLVASVDGSDEDATLPPKLASRLAFHVTDAATSDWAVTDICRAQSLLPTLAVSPDAIQGLCQAAIAIGITSPRSVLHAVTTARGIAALKNLRRVDDDCLALAAQLVLAHRALHLPPHEQPRERDAQEQAPAQANAFEGTDHQMPPRPADAEIILEAIKATLPPHLLQLATEGLGKRRAGRNVKSNAPRKALGQRGRRIGHKRASSITGHKIDILATLRTAAPWQPLRRKLAGTDRMVVTRDDFRVARIKQRNEATAIFAVDASGSTAFQRLAEAKGAVETILAECYVRRDKVALVAFRSKKAELLLPPTRSLERAKRALAGLPGGGGTPLASGLDEAFALAVQVRRGGGHPIVICLTDGRANVTRDGEGNKAKALDESQAAARVFAAEGFNAMVIDVSPEPQKTARALAEAMHATYLPMPRATASDIARPIHSALKAVSA